MSAPKRLFLSVFNDASATHSTELAERVAACIKDKTAAVADFRRWELAGLIRMKTAMHGRSKVFKSVRLTKAGVAALAPATEKTAKKPRKETKPWPKADA